MRRTHDTAIRKHRTPPRPGDRGGSLLRGHGGARGPGRGSVGRLPARASAAAHRQTRTAVRPWRAIRPRATRRPSASGTMPRVSHGAGSSRCPPVAACRAIRVSQVGPEPEQQPRHRRRVVAPERERQGEHEEDAAEDHPEKPGQERVAGSEHEAHDPECERVHVGRPGSVIRRDLRCAPRLAEARWRRPSRRQDHGPLRHWTRLTLCLRCSSGDRIREPRWRPVGFRGSACL